MENVDVVVVGAGASGLMCAWCAAKRGRSVVVLDSADVAAKKIAISGGGKCNFTNLKVSSENYVSGNKHFVKSALSRFEPIDFISILNDHNIPFAEKEDGQLFCLRSSGDIVKMLLRECETYGVKILAPCRVKSVLREGDGFHVTTTEKKYFAESVVVATGALSYPQLGATDFGYKVAKQFGLELTSLQPGLVPLLFGKKNKQLYSKLSGLSLRVGISVGEKSYIGDMLFTHLGISGPVVLNASLYWQKGEDVEIDLLPGIDIYDLMDKRKREAGKIALHNFLSKYLPSRFAELWCQINASKRLLADYSLADLKVVAEKLHSWRLRPSDTDGFKKAEVTVGGVDTNEISSKTFEAKKASGLFFIGEVLDVTGELGGYNLHWAWASGFAASEYV